MFGNYSLTSLLIYALTLVIALPIHEFAHAWTADQLGDDTPRANGRLTLNPFAHLDPIGSLMLIFAGFGWAKPVPVNTYALQRRTPAGVMLVSAAGPFSNLLQAILAAIPFRIGVFQGVASGGLLGFLYAFLQSFIFLNLILLFFNLLPLFPLDGEKVAEYFLPYGARETLYQLRPYGPFILIALIFLGRLGGFDLLGTLIGAPANAVFSLLVHP